MKNNKKGNATVYLVVIVLLVIAVASLFIKLNWRRFKAEASFGFTVAAVIIAVLLILFFMIRHSIRKARKEKEKEKARLEMEKRNQERVAAGLQPETLGNGKLELSDVSEAAKKAAGKATEKIDDFLSGGDKGDGGNE